MNLRFMTIICGVLLLCTLLPLSVDRTAGFADAVAQPAVAPRVKMLSGAGAAPEEPTQRVFYSSYDGDEAEWHLVRRRLAEAGAWRVSGFFPDAIVCELPVSVDPWSVLDGTGLAATLQESLSEERIEASPRRLRGIYRTYQKIDTRRKANTHVPRDIPSPPYSAFESELELVPAVPLPRTDDGTRTEFENAALAPAQGDDPPLYYQNTEFLAGNILIRIVFPESRGGQQETWTATTKQRAETVIRQSLDYFDRHFRNFDLNYDFHRKTIETEYEPIRRQLDQTQYTLWIDDMMTREGFHTGGIIAKVHAFNEDLHQYFTLSDWVFTVFVVNAENDADHLFDGRAYAQAELGGPFMIVPYSTATEAFFEDLFLHAMVQVFWGSWEDQGGWTCGLYCGYLNVKNGNKNNPDPLGTIWSCDKTSLAVDCISQSRTVEGALYGFPYDGPPCDFTYGQLGYRDGNRNNVPDVFDSPPVVTFRSAWPETLLSFNESIPFTVTSTAVVNRNSEAAEKGPLRNYATPIKTVAYGLNGAGSALLNPVDGEEPDEPQEEYEIALSFLLPGMSTLEVTATNAYAAKSQPYTKRVFYIGLDYDSFRMEYPNDGVGIAWYLRGRTFDARLKLVRYDYSVEPAAVDTVAWPDDLQPVSVTQGGLTPYYFLDTTVNPGSDYGYVVEGDFELYYAPTQETRTFTSGSREVRTFAPLPRADMMSTPAPNPYNPHGAQASGVLVSIEVPGAKGLSLFSKGGPSRAAGQTGTGEEVEPIKLSVGVYDVAGRRIQELFDDAVFVEVVNVTWDGRNYKGDLVPSGMYFFKAQVGDQSDSKKVLIIR
jgi:hypothetical protein